MKNLGKNLSFYEFVGAHCVCSQTGKKFMIEKRDEKKAKIFRTKHSIYIELPCPACDGAFKIDLEVKPHFTHVVKELKSKKFNIPNDILSIKKMEAMVEELLIRRALMLTQGNRTLAAKLLEISHRALLYKIIDYKIEK